ncbi:MAG: PorV/PorQ family protein [Candidatus Delongbacteria bacterium]|nr:PorV/PorQ family protein [Candidatus Delongbacteria bacterium]
MRIKSILAIVVLASSFALTQAGTSNIGTAGGTDLRIPIGAMGTSLSGALVGDVTGVDAIFWNPAGVAYSKENEAVMGNMQYFADMKVNLFGYAHNLGRLGSIGVAVRMLNIGDLYVTTTSMPEGTGEIIQPTFTTVSFNYARIMTDRVAIGFNAHLKQEKIKDMTATGFLFDFGVRVQTPMDGLRFGVVMKNFGPQIQYDGDGGEFHSNLPGDEPNADNRVTTLEFAKADLPSTFQFGLAYDLVSNALNRLTLMTTYQGNDFSADEYRFGMEYSFANMFFLRSGYVTADQDDYLYGYSLGGGLRLNLGANDLYVDYSYNPMEYFDANQWYTFRFTF